MDLIDILSVLSALFLKHRRFLMRLKISVPFDNVDAYNYLSLNTKKKKDADDPAVQKGADEEEKSFFIENRRLTRC